MINKVIKNIIFMLTLLMGLSIVSATVNVINVDFIENVYEQVSYNPLQASSGNWSDTGEIQSIYTPTGEMIIKNNHPTDAINDIVLNVSGINNIYNLANSVGRTAIITTTGNYSLITIPDLAAGQNTTLSYNINETLISPPINFTSNYSQSRILAGLDVGIQDNAKNVMNSGSYPSTCVYNITQSQSTGSFGVGGITYNFTLNSSSLTGLDSTNASILNSTNQSLTWNIWAGGCLNSGNNTNINYRLISPSEVPTSNTYQIMNTTITYRVNTTVSHLKLLSINSTVDQEVNFNKYQVNVLTGDNATWRITSNVVSLSNISVNLTEVTLWVSVRNSTGTGFTNPSNYENDTVSGAKLLKTYIPNQIMNSSLPGWSTSGGTEWFFNSTYSSSPIVWMDLKNNIIDDGVQLTNSSVTFGNNTIYIKELYIATGYWLEITKNITRIADNNYTIFIEVMNKGSSATPSNQGVVIYNFLPNTFNLTSQFVFSSSLWYSTAETNTTLNDPTYNGTMYQFAILNATNAFNSSLDKWGGARNVNNSWNVTYNVTGSGEFNFEDLFLTGVDPLQIKQYGGTKSLSIENVYNVLSAKGEYLLMGVAVIVGGLLLFF